MGERELIRGSPVNAVEFSSSWARQEYLHSECERELIRGSPVKAVDWSSLPAELGWEYILNLRE